MGHPAEPAQSGPEIQKPRVNLVAGIHAVGDDAGANHLIGCPEIHKPRGIIQMPNGDVHPTGFKHVVKFCKPSRLSLSPA